MSTGSVQPERTNIELSKKERRRKSMAKATLHPMFKQIRGKIGRIVFRRSHSGEIVLTKHPDMSDVKWSPAQKAHRQHFKEAVAYARAAMATPDVRAAYQQMATENHKRPFDMAVSDYFKGNNLLSKHR
jgi:hypothetical protein